MSADLGVLYHWSPKRNRESIQRFGLQLAHLNRTGGVFSAPWICLSTTPSSGWALILEPGEEGEWDLWQTSLRNGDNVTIRADFDLPFIREVRVHNGLPSDRVWFVGERSA